MDRFKYFLDKLPLIDGAQSPERLTQELASIANDFGFEACAVAALPHPNRPFRQQVYIHKWPTGWLDRYVSNRYELHDPVFRHINTCFKPFEWSEARYDKSLEPKAALVMNEAAEFGMAVGFCVPTYRRNGEIINTTFGGSRSEIGPHEKAALHLAAIYAQTRLTELIDGKLPTPNLSERQLDVLRYASEGKTTTQIAKILGIAEDTVKYHVEMACRKLNVSSRSAAIAKAIYARIL